MRRLMFLFSFFILSSVVFAHFGVILPSKDIVTKNDKKTINLKIMFMHPMEQSYMNMEKPKEFGVFINGKKINLTDNLKEGKAKGHKIWKLRYRVTQPGDYIFYTIPQPYWEEAEDKFIMHYTKVIVNAYGMENNWDKEIGLKTEIVPLVRPYGLWSGNVFRGIVKVDGKPAPFTEVEVEYFNKGNKIKVPSESFITQVIKCDSNGVFTYAMPYPGWWGFAALNTDTKKIKKDGKGKEVEIGAVLWVKTEKMKKGK